MRTAGNTNTTTKKEITRHADAIFHSRVTCGLSSMVGAGVSRISHTMVNTGSPFTGITMSRTTPTMATSMLTFKGGDPKPLPGQCSELLLFTHHSSAARMFSRQRSTLQSTDLVVPSSCGIPNGFSYFLMYKLVLF